MPEPLPWETSGFWVLVYGAVFLAVLVRSTWGKDDEARRRIVRRIVIGVAVLALVAHLALAWHALMGLSGIPSAFGRRDPRGSASILIDATSHTAAVLAALLLSILFASGCRRPRPAGRAWRVPWEWPLAGGLVVLGSLLQIHGRFYPGMGPLRPPPGWIDRACVAGGFLALVAALVVLMLVVALVRSRGPAHAARREEMRDALALWGFLLFAGALLFLEWRTVSLLSEVMYLGRSSPGGGSLLEIWLHSNRVILLAVFFGVVAMCFGGLHFGRREKPA